jgi:hydrogenase maturation factor
MKHDCTHEGCLTCTDALLTATVLRINAEDNLAIVAISGRQEEIDISLVAPVAPGQVLLVHGGIALADAEEETQA